MQTARKGSYEYPYFVMSIYKGRIVAGDSEIMRQTKRAVTLSSGAFLFLFLFSLLFFSLL